MACMLRQSTRIASSGRHLHGRPSVLCPPPKPQIHQPKHIYVRRLPTIVYGVSEDDNAAPVEPVPAAAAVSPALQAGMIHDQNSDSSSSSDSDSSSSSSSDDDDACGEEVVLDAAARMQHKLEHKEKKYEDKLTKLNDKLEKKQHKLEAKVAKEERKVVTGEEKKQLKQVVAEIVSSGCSDTDDSSSSSSSSSSDSDTE